MTNHLAENYTKQMEALKGSMPALDPARDTAIKAFAVKGIPHKKDENWRYAKLTHLRDTAYPIAKSSSKTAPAVDGDFAGVITYVNGRLDESQCHSSRTMKEVRVSHLSNKIAGNESRVDSLLSDGDGITLLNTALMQGGYVINVPAGVKIEKPILIHHIMSDADKQAVHLRHSLELGEGAQITIIEYFSGDDSAYWLNNHLEIRVSQEASLTHLRLLSDGANATQTGKLYVDLDAHGYYKSFSLATGGEMLRSESHVRILGEEANAILDCIALAAPGQIHDVLTTVDHATPNSVSNQMFRAVLAKKGKSAFQGKVVVRKDAQHTLADQTCNSILLDRTAEANAKPELEIWADDVKCSHGATVGELDDKALFYLMARGIAPKEARALLVEAFVAAVTERLDSDQLKEIVTSHIQLWLDQYLREKS